MFILHFLFSLVLLVLIVISLFLYFYFLYWIVLKIFRRKNILSLKSKKVIKIFLLFFLFNITIYANQLIQWTGADNANIKAKPYFAVGNVVSFYRVSLASILKPSNILVYHFRYLQKLVYVVGEAQLPKDDGEREIWKYHWFVYPYAKYMSVPHSFWYDDTSISKEKEIPQIVWDTIKAIKKDDFQDEEIRFYAYKIVPILTTYIQELHNHEKIPHTIFLTKELEQKFIDANIGLTKSQIGQLGHEKHRTQEFKDKLVNLWIDLNKREYKLDFIREYITELLIETKVKWNQNERMKSFLKKEPKLEFMRLIELHNYLKNVLLFSNIYCNHQKVLLYLQTREEILKKSDELKDNVFVQKLFYRTFEWWGHTPSILKYMFETHCHHKVAIDYSKGYKRTPQRTLSLELKYRYKDIIEKLKKGNKDGR